MKIKAIIPSRGQEKTITDKFSCELIDELRMGTDCEAEVHWEGRTCLLTVETTELFRIPDIHKWIYQHGLMIL